MDNLYAFNRKRFRDIATQLHLEYHCKAVFETFCITSESSTEPQLSQVKLGVFCYIMTVQSTVHVLWINLYRLSTL
jgi:hypothetical protein